MVDFTNGVYLCDVTPEMYSMTIDEYIAKKNSDFKNGKMQVEKLSKEEYNVANRIKSRDYFIVFNEAIELFKVIKITSTETNYDKFNAESVTVNFGKVNDFTFYYRQCDTLYYKRLSEDYTIIDADEALFNYLKTLFFDTQNNYHLIDKNAANVFNGDIDLRKIPSNFISFNSYSKNEKFADIIDKIYDTKNKALEHNMKVLSKVMDNIKDETLLFSSYGIIKVDKTNTDNAETIAINYNVRIELREDYIYYRTKENLYLDKIYLIHDKSIAENIIESKKIILNIVSQYMKVKNSFYK